MTDLQGETPMSRPDRHARPIVVGLGASAGGIEALKEFFTHVEPASGTAYVVILHLSPDYESRLAAVLQVTARIPVTPVTAPVEIEPDHVYVVPQNKILDIEGTRLDISEMTRLEQRRSPVDLFFKALADAHGARSVCVVLAGTGADGSAGLKRVKEYGGLAIAQDPQEAEYQDMPRNAIATGLVDLVLPVAQMAARIAAFARLVETFHLALRPARDASFLPIRAQAKAVEPRAADGIAPADLHLRLLEQYAAPSLVISEDHSVIHVSERATRYLQVAPGEPSRDLFRLIRPELRSGLRAALHQAAKQRITIDVQGLPFGSDNGGQLVDLKVRPVLRDGEPPRGFFLVMFEPGGVAGDDYRAAGDRARTAAASDHHVEDGNDFQNLLNATDIGAIFLDRSLRVKLSTPKARQVFNLLDSDMGRPLSDITSSLKDVDIHGDMKSVLDRLQHIEREVQTEDEQWYLMRVLPYRTTDNRIDGVVVTFQDITARRHAEQHVRESEERLRVLIESATDYAICTLNERGAIDSWSPGAERMFGYGADEAIGQHFGILFTPEDRAAGVPERELSQARTHRRAADERYHVRKNGTRFYCSGVTTRLGDGGIGFAKIARDLTESAQAKADLERARAELERRVELRTAELAREVRGHGAANKKVLKLLRRVVSSEEDERRRISHELHDDIGQQLTVLRLALEREQASSPEHTLSPALELTASISRAIDFIAWQLRPAVLDELGLAAALPRFVSTWSLHVGIHADCRVERYGAGMLSAEAEVAFYRILQEALHNVAKHARARRADVVLTVTGDQVVLIVEDNGVGFDVLDITRSSQGLGLTSMRERAALVNASLQVESEPGKGTSIFLRCAIAPSATPQVGQP
jgi:PAS domain S-box-containing protein